MRLRFEQLESHLARELLPIYLVSGDEPLQAMEAADAIRAQARARGFAEREVLHAEAGFDWGSLAAASDNLSLFAEQRLLELNIPNAKPGDAGSKALVAYAEHPPADCLLLINCAKLDKRQQQGKWFKALEQQGAVLQVWPLDYQALPGWIERRMRAKGLKPSPEAAQLLADRVEGNMLAAAQEIDKLRLLHGDEPIDGEAILASVADSARFTVFDWVDAALAGEAERASHILEGLYGEGGEPVLMLWALAREIRALEAMAAGLAEGQGMGAVLAAQRVWDKRKPLYQGALARHPGVRRWQHFLVLAARIDRMIKGLEQGTVRDELLHLALLVAGLRLR